MQAKNALDGRRILDSVAVCDWLDSSHVTVRSLHSKCLYVDRLPPNYRDMGEFRRVFSAVVNPPYCQVGESSYYRKRSSINPEIRSDCPEKWVPSRLGLGGIHTGRGRGKDAAELGRIFPARKSYQGGLLHPRGQSHQPLSETS